MKSEVIIIDSEAYYRLRADLIDGVKTEIRALGEQLLNTNRDADDWITPEAARKLLGVGKTKYQELKNSDAFKFSQHGRKVKVSRKSVLAFLKQNSF